MTGNLFLKLIHPAPIEGLLHINSRELEKIKALAINHNLLLLLYKRLGEQEKDVISNGDIREFLKGTEPLYYKNVVRTTRQQESAAKTVSLLKAKGLPSLVLRGSKIAEEIYDAPFCRVSADIDILIRISDALTVDEVMTKAGFSRTDGLPLKFLMTRLHHAVYRDADTSYLIEIHWNFGIPSYFSLSSEEIWEGTVSPDGLQLGFSQEMTLIQLLIHHHMHAFRELKILVDILWVLHQYEKTIDWKKFIATIEKTGLSKATQITLFQIRNLWSEADRLSAEEILSNELRQGRCKVPLYLLSFFSMDIKKRYHFQAPGDKFMARLALDRWNAILHSFTKTFFPPPSAIRELYGDFRKWTLPINYIRFLSWRISKAKG